MIDMLESVKEYMIKNYCCHSIIEKFIKHWLGKMREERRKVM